MTIEREKEIRRDGEKKKREKRIARRPDEDEAKTESMKERKKERSMKE